jgi:MoaA/NifB/PqqE/SkfB family radical SAM enzyme
LALKTFRESVNVLKGPYAVRQKINYLRYALSSKKEELSYKPVILSIVATGRCTLSCDMCPTHSRLIPGDYRHAQNAVGDMPFGVFKKAVDSFSEAITVSIIGSGEPLLNKDFFRMVDYAAKKRRMLVKTFTNGTPLQENTEKILDSGLDGITVSLNAQNADEYGRLTGVKNDMYGKICDSLNTLIQRRNAIKSSLKIKVSFIIDRQNYRSMNEMIELAAGLGVDTIFLCNFLPSPYEGFKPEERALFYEDEEARNFIRENKRRLHPSLKRKVRWPVLISRDAGNFNCASHFSQLRVDGEGNIGSCSMMLLNMSGNGKIDDKEIWNNDFFRRMRRNFLTGQKESLSEQCLACPDNLGIEV